jgi:hypothetical protein
MGFTGGHSRPAQDCACGAFMHSARNAARAFCLRASSLFSVQKLTARDTAQEASLQRPGWHAQSQVSCCAGTWHWTAVPPGQLGHPRVPAGTALHVPTRGARTTTVSHRVCELGSQTRGVQLTAFAAAAQEALASDFAISWASWTVQPQVVEAGSAVIHAMASRQFWAAAGPAAAIQAASPSGSASAPREDGERLLRNIGPSFRWGRVD